MTETASFRDSFLAFARVEARGSSPLYEHLCRDVAARNDVTSLLYEAPAAQRRPNLLLAAVHYLLLSGTVHPLAAYYPSVGGARAPDEELVGQFANFCIMHRNAVVRLLGSRATQTNEIARSAMLVAALQELDAETAVGLVDVGASAGLNLLCDRFRINFGGHHVGPSDARLVIDCELIDGKAPDAGRATIARRVGIDPTPLDASDLEDRQWLRACIWPEHTRRRRLLDAALDIAEAEPPDVLEGDAFAVPQALRRIPNELHACVFHSATLAYLPPDERSEFASMLDEQARQRRRLSWISLEGPFLAPFDQLSGKAAAPPPKPAYFLLGLTTWHDGHRDDRLLGRADPHGRWLQWLSR